jgi:hypothetical protein
LTKYPLYNVLFPLLVVVDYNTSCNSCVKVEYELLFDTGIPTNGL